MEHVTDSRDEFPTSVVGWHDGVETGLLALVAVLYPFGFAVSVGDATVTASAGDPLVAVVLLAASVGAIPVRTFPKLFGLVGLFIAVVVIGIVVRSLTNPAYFVLADSVVALMKLLGSVTWMVAIYVLVRRDIYRRTWLFGVLTVVSAAVFSVVGMDINQGLRPSGPFTNPNLFADYLLFAIFLAVTFAYWTVRSPSRKLPTLGVLFLTAGVAFVGLVATASRAAFVGLLVGMVVVVDWRSASRRVLTDLRFMAVTVIGIGFAYLTTTGGFRIFQRFQGALSGGSVGHRLRTWPHSLQGLFEYPLFGIGIGQHPNYLDLSVNPHNTLILLVSGTGLVGGVLAIWIVLRVVRHAFVLKFDGEARLLQLLVGYFVAVFVVGMFHDINNFRTFWIAIGLLMAAVVATETEDDARATESVARSTGQ